MVKAIVGANWGDEGKGKLTDMLAEKSDIVVRFQGGANAGHTIINKYGKFALHSLPSGVFYGHTTNIIGNGVAVDIYSLEKEILGLRKCGVPVPKLIVSERAQVIMPYHPDFDIFEEERLAGRSFGSTKSGIAPFYSDKYAKIGLQVCELYDDGILEERISKVCEIKNTLLVHFYGRPALNHDMLIEEMKRQREILNPFVGDSVCVLRESLRNGAEVLLEGQLGTLKDTDFGIYPNVTSSHTLAAFGCVGAGIPPMEIKEIIAVTKAYSSAVGSGEFVTEVFGDEAETLRRLGGDAGEYGATTGRPRRVGWFDAVATKYGCFLQGASEVALTAIDVLGYLDEIKVCVGYEIEGVVTENFPVTPLLRKAKPVYKTFKGWKRDLRGLRDYDEMPAEAKAYVDFIESYIGITIRLVSTGPRREDIAVRK